MKENDQNILNMMDILDLFLVIDKSSSLISGFAIAHFSQLESCLQRNIMTR